MGSRRATNLPWLTGDEDPDNLVDGDSPGGIIHKFKAGAALNIGDIVYLSAAHTVNKSADVADYDAVIGVVVGGKTTNYEVLQDDIDVGVQAAAANEVVLVCTHGKAKVVADDAITLGDKLTSGGTTAGAAAVGAITTDLAAGQSGSLVGTALETAAAGGDIILCLVNVH
jgi:hypothetical protein